MKSLEKTFFSLRLVRGFESFGVVEVRERVRMRWAVEGVGEKGVRVHTVVGVERAGDEGTLGVVIIWVLEREESRK